MRRIPIKLAKFLGRTTAKYRWFAVVYIVCMFFLFPLVVFGLSIPGWQVLAGVGIPVIVLAITIGVIKVMQHYCPQCLPKVLHNWNFLPECLRSLAPLDRQITRLILCCACCKCCRSFIEEADESEEIVKKSAEDEENPDTVDPLKGVVVDRNGHANSNLGFIADDTVVGGSPSAVWGSDPEKYETML